MENNTKPFYNTTIPSDWEVKKGKNISDKITKGSSPNWQGFKYQDEGVLFVTSENVRDGFLNISKPKFLPFEFNDKLKNSVLCKGDILINIVGASIGRSCVYNIDAIANINQAVCILRPDKTVSREFVSYFLQLPKSIDKLLNTQSDSARPNLTLEDIRNFNFNIPPLPEQRAIAHALSVMDAAINKNQQLIAQKELRKKWLMQNLLTGKKRLKGFSGEWKNLHIRDVSKEVSIRNKEDKQLTVLSCTKYDGLVPSLEYFGRKIYSDDLSTYKIVPCNHFAYATNHIEEGSIGYQEILDEALISPMYTVFKTDASINNSFFYKLLKSHKLVYQYQNRMEGSIARRGGLRWDAFSIIKIHIPSHNEQTAIAQVLQAADKEIELLKAKTEKLREQKKGMMQVLLTGKKRLKINN